MKSFLYDIKNVSLKFFAKKYRFVQASTSLRPFTWRQVKILTSRLNPTNIGCAASVRIIMNIDPMRMCLRNVFSTFRVLYKCFLQTLSYSVVNELNASIHIFARYFCQYFSDVFSGSSKS